MAKKNSSKAVTAEAVTVVVPPIEQTQVVVPIEGVSPLIVHRMSAKVKKEMLDRMQGKKLKRETKNPDEEYEGAFYRLRDGTYGFPALALKNAMVRAGKLIGLPMTDLRQMFFVHGDGLGDDGMDLIRIKGKPSRREDGVRVGMGQGGANDLRYRPEFRQWSADPMVEFDHHSIAVEQIFNLVNRAGFAVGICEWRPERNGPFGRFRVVTGKRVVKGQAKEARRRRKGAA